MRKGADCLSKWVGEAERQLRLLFDEAKAQQPSIIFFDEIDGMIKPLSPIEDSITDKSAGQVLPLCVVASKNRSMHLLCPHCWL